MYNAIPIKGNKDIWCMHNHMKTLWCQTWTWCNPTLFNNLLMICQLIISNYATGHDISFKIKLLLLLFGWWCSWLERSPCMTKDANADCNKPGSHSSTTEHSKTGVNIILGDLPTTIAPGLSRQPSLLPCTGLNQQPGDISKWLKIAQKKRKTNIWTQSRQIVYIVTMYMYKNTKIINLMNCRLKNI